MHLPARTVVLVLLAGSYASAQAPGRPPAAGPRTPWGDPDLQGTYNYATMTPLERPREFADRPTISDAEARAYEQRTIERQAAGNNTAGPDWWDPGTRTLWGNRTSLIVDPPDGRVPALTAETQKALAARQRGRRNYYDGPEELALKERCLSWETAGPPMLPAVYNNDMQLVQTRDYVVIFNEMIHDARIVPLDGRPHGALARWMGDSRGHWEGGSLVIDTINFTDKTSIRNSDTHLHLVERLTRTTATELEYRATLEDPTVWVRPWTFTVAMRQTSEPMYEYACHEGNNRSVEGMLRGSRVQDR